MTWLSFVILSAAVVAIVLLISRDRIQYWMLRQKKRRMDY